MTAAIATPAYNQSVSSEREALSVVLPGTYRLLSKFILRMTGFPLELMNQLSSPVLAAAADEVRRAGEHTAGLANELLSPSRLTDRRLRRHIKKGHVINISDWPDAMAEELGTYENSRRAHEKLKESAYLIYQDELHKTLRHLYGLARDERFRSVLLLSCGDLERLTPVNVNPSFPRSSQSRQRELTWASYVQRLSTKNETISFFGPSVWGEVDSGEMAAAAIELDTPAIDRSSVYVERWVCDGLAKLMSDDPEVWPVLVLRIADNAVIGPQHVTLLGGDRIELHDGEWAFLQACERSVQRSLNNPLAETLVERKVLARNIRVPASIRPFPDLLEEVASWPHCAARSSWMEQLERIERARAAVENSFDLNSRRDALALLQKTVSECGVNKRRESRLLYVSRLAVNEDCRRNAKKVVLGQPVIDQVENDLAPWFDLWRDFGGLYATRMHEALLPIWQSLGGKPVPVPLFLRACDDQGFFLTVSGGSRLWPEVEREVQQAWREELGDQFAASEITLTNEQLKFVSKRFRFSRLKAFDNPSPDLQIIARNEEALRDGNWTLLVAETHPDFSSWEHCLSMWCPDQQEYAKEYRQGTLGAVAVVGPYPPYFSAVHTAISIYPFVHQWTFVGVQGPHGTRTVRSADSLVTMTADDVCVHDYDGRLLGSLLHNWSVASNTHRLDLRGTEGHMPRLKVGRVIVQRQTWVIQPTEELRATAGAGGYAMFAALRQLQADYGLPDCIFVKPVGGQKFSLLTKHEKPVFVDFRSPILVEILTKMIKNFRRIVVTEMLPGIEDCWLQDPDGHYCCEFRTVVVATDGH